MIKVPRRSRVEQRDAIYAGAGGGFLPDEKSEWEACFSQLLGSFQMKEGTTMSKNISHRP